MRPEAGEASEADVALAPAAPRRHRGAHGEDARLFGARWLPLLRAATADLSWLLGRPVSNSGRLAGRLRDRAAAHGWPWRVELLFNPDTALLASPAVAVTSDSTVLDGVARWLNLAASLAPALPGAWVVDLRE